MCLEKLTDLLFPDVEHDCQYYLDKYEPRNLSPEACVTRYAPSPTGFQHIGGVFAALVSERIAKLSGGVFFLRIEDTDQKREVEGAIEDTVITMHKFGIDFDEGMLSADTEKGAYGPYRQSQRETIYKTFAKDLVRRNLAYPCFCSSEELVLMREKQTTQQLTPGYWGEFAKCRNMSCEQAVCKLEAGEKCVLRLRSPGSPENRIDFVDLIKGEVSFPENNQDIVLIKGDGLPTYHLAHAVDDTLMRTTHVLRGEEWLSSLPIHVQLFSVLGFKLPAFGHIPNVMKQEGTGRRKLSKRKDPESAVTYYDEQGYPPQSVVEYLLNMINSSFEDWRKENPDTSYREFKVALDRMSKSGALFDLVKLSDVSKDVIGKMTANDVYEKYEIWAHKFSSEMHKLITQNEGMTRAIFSIDRGGTNPRKDFAKWSDVKEKTSYFFDELFAHAETQFFESGSLKIEEMKRIIGEYLKVYTHNQSKEAWFEQLKVVGAELGYTSDRKAFKKSPELYRGMVADVASTIRLALTRRANTPDLYAVIQILGENRVKSRFVSFLK
jgi:glutamyl-tRNA synthetase